MAHCASAELALISFLFFPPSAQVVVLFACHIMSSSIEALLQQLLTQACHGVTANLLYSFVSPSPQCGKSLFLDLGL